jgi:hypothetical protein
MPKFVAGKKAGGKKAGVIAKVPYGAPGASKNPFSGAMAAASTKKKGK